MKAHSNPEPSAPLSKDQPPPDYLPQIVKHVERMIAWYEENAKKASSDAGKQAFSHSAIALGSLLAWLKILPSRAATNPVGRCPKNSPYHKPTSVYCLDCLPADAPLGALLLSNREPTQSDIERGLEIQKMLDERKGAANPVGSPADELVIEICRELYDRFVMGGWEPQDAHDWVRERLTHE